MRTLVLTLSLLFSQSLAAADLQVTVKKDAANAVTITSTQSTATPLVLGNDPGVDVSITCDNFLCTTVKVFLDAQDLTNTLEGDNTSLAGSILADRFTTASAKLKISAGGQEKEFTVDASAAVSARAGTTTATTTALKPLTEVLAKPCIGSAVVAGRAYDARANRAVMAIDPLGNVRQAPVEAIDEDDIVEVYLVGHPAALPFLRVRRTSPMRSFEGLNIIGSGLTVRIPTTPQQAGGIEPPTPPCDRRRFVLKDFAPGAAEIELSAFVDGQSVPIQTIPFAVSPLYDGMFSVGAATSDLTDRTFTVVKRGTESVVAEKREGATTRFAVMYTPFWHKRDPAKPRPFSVRQPRTLLEHINPMVGITLSDIGKNALAGVSLDLGPFVLSYGVHVSDVRRLSERSGLKPGDPFTGTEADLPVVTGWETDNFVAVSIDLRAALKLLGTVGGAAAPAP